MAGGKGDKSAAMLRATRHLARKKGSGLPLVLALTDRLRAPDPFRVAARMPRGAGLVWRTYGETPARADCRRLGALVHGKRGRLLRSGVGPGPRGLSIDGLHLPERVMKATYTDRMFRHRNSQRPDQIVTAAAHSETAIVAAAKAGVHAVLLSPVFATASHPGATTLGVIRFARLARLAASHGLFVYALGGVTDEVAIRRLAGSGANGVAGIGFLTR